MLRTPKMGRMMAPKPSDRAKKALILHKFGVQAVLASGTLTTVRSPLLLMCSRYGNNYGCHCGLEENEEPKP